MHRDYIASFYLDTVYKEDRMIVKEMAIKSGADIVPVAKVN